MLFHERESATAVNAFRFEYSRTGTPRVPVLTPKPAGHPTLAAAYVQRKRLDNHVIPFDATMLHGGLFFGRGGYDVEVTESH